MSGRAVSLFPETFRNFNFCNKPIESGSDFKRLEEASSSSRFSNPAIASGMTCVILAKVTRKGKLRRPIMNAVDLFLSITYKNQNFNQNG